MPTTVPFMVMPVMVRAWGPRACFARPEFATERVSFQVPTPSAVRGLLEAIYWKPQFSWRVREIRVLKPVKWFNETRNEVSTKASRTSLTKPYLCDGPNRLQRHTLGLEDVDYVFVAEAIPYEYTMAEVLKHAEIFNTRVATGQAFKTPVFGNREYPASFDVATGAEPPIDLSMDLGLMPFDFRYNEATSGDRYNVSRVRPDSFRYPAKLVKGVVTVPDEMYEQCGRTILPAAAGENT